MSKFWSCLRFVVLLYSFSVLSIITIPAHADVPAQQDTAADKQKIDQLLKLIDQRLNIADLVAKAKWNADQPVNDTAREQVILNGIRQQASSMGVSDTEFVAAFFQNQFDASKMIQNRLIMHWHSVYPDKYKFSDAVDLKDTLRPELDKLTPQLIQAVVNVRPLLNQPEMLQYLSSQSKKLIRDDLDGEVRRTALTLLIPEKIEQTE